MTRLSLPLAEQRHVYRISDVERALAGLEENPSPLLKKTYLKMCEAGETRLLVKPSNEFALEALYEECPNFSDILDDLRKYLELALFGGEALTVLPILLLGDPEVGKTHFAKSLANAIQTEFEFCSMATLSASWLICGAASSWKDARPGKVAMRIIDGHYANPVIVLDELDKAVNSNFEPVGPLYQLFERETATDFKDEFIDIKLDASHILWVCTANDLASIPDPIVSRMMVYEVRRPTKDEARRIAQRMYQALLREHSWPFVSSLSDDSLDTLASVPPREMKKRILDALGQARMQRRDYVQPSDIGRTAAREQKRIGFTN
jgi:ATP-dependent Lon protease